MSKASKRRRARVKQRDKLYDTHHIFFPRKSYEKDPWDVLRSFYYCKITIPKYTIHDEIHETISSIPPPDNFSAIRALSSLLLLRRQGGIAEDDPAEKRLKVLIALFDCSNQPTADALRQQLEIVQKYNKKSPPE